MSRWSTMQPRADEVLKLINPVAVDAEVSKFHRLQGTIEEVNDLSVTMLIGTKRTHLMIYRLAKIGPHIVAHESYLQEKGLT